MNFLGIKNLTNKNENQFNYHLFLLNELFNNQIK
jgi:hypothetical protein